VTQIRLLNERTAKGGPPAHTVYAQVFADGGVCVMVPPDPTPSWLTSLGLSRVLASARANGDKLTVHVEPGDARAQAPVLKAIEGAGYAGDFEAVPQMIGYNNGSTTLHFAVETARVDLMLEQLGLGANIESRDAGGRTPLLLAAEMGRTEMVRRLVERGADYRARDDLQNTVLMYAAQVGDIATVRLLYVAGADLNARGQNDMTALAVATKCQQDEVASLLRGMGARE
jgi:hypothetical protein